MKIIDRKTYDFERNIRNIKRDVDGMLLLHGMTEADILYVRNGTGAKMSKERFLEIADKDYDCLDFKDRVNVLAVIVCKKAIMFYDTTGVLDCIRTDAEYEDDFDLVLGGRYGI